jgi:hypothetical protein
MWQHWSIPWHGSTDFYLLHLLKSALKRQYFFMLLTLRMKQLKSLSQKWLPGMFPTLLKSLAEVNSCTMGLFWEGNNLIDCTVLYLSDIKWFKEYFEATTFKVPQKNWISMKNFVPHIYIFIFTRLTKESAHLLVTLHTDRNTIHNSRQCWPQMH